MPRTTRQKPRQATISPPTVDGGLFFDPDALPSTELYHFYDRRGRRIGFWQAAEGAADAELVEAFLEFLSRRDGRRLTLLPPSPSRRV